jgi:hypothetical protein
MKGELNMRSRKSLPSVAFVILLGLLPVSRAENNSIKLINKTSLKVGRDAEQTSAQADESARANEAKAALIQKALSEMDRDLNEFIKSRDELINAMPASKPEYAPSEIDKMLADSRRVVEIERRLVNLWLDYAARRKSHLPALPELSLDLRRLATADQAMDEMAKLLLSKEQEQLDMLQQMQQAYHEQDARRWNSLNQQYEAIRQQSIDLSGQSKQIVAKQDEITVEVKAALERLLISLKSKEDKCAPLDRQLERDKEALRRQMKVNEMGLKELEEWTKANKEAEVAALTLAAKTILGHVAINLEGQINSMRSFKGWLTRYDKAIRKRGVPFEVLQVKIERAYSGYVNAWLAAKTGRVLNAGLLINDVWSSFKKECGAIAEQQAKSDAAVRDILNDPTVKKLIETDDAGQEFAQSLLELMSRSKELEKIIGPEVELGSFLVDYGYEAIKWAASRNRILQQTQLSEESLKAFDALKEQIESTTRKLKECRTPAIARRDK